MGLAGGDYQLTLDQSTDRTDAGETMNRTVRNTVNLRYRGFMSPVVENEITLKIEKENRNDGTDTLKINPVITLNYKGNYWGAGARRTVDESNEPGRERKTTDSYFVEFYIRPNRSTLPDLKGKYSLDLDTEPGITDTRKQTVELSSIYQPIDPLTFRGDYGRMTNEDLLKADSDTEEEKMSFTAGVRLFPTEKIKLNSEFKVETIHSATLKSDGTGATPGSYKQDHTNTWKNTAAFRPFRVTTVDASYDFELKENFATGEHNSTRSGKASVTQKILEPFDIRGEVSQVVTEAKYSSDDNRKTEDTYTVDLMARFNKALDFTAKYQKKDTVEDHADPTRNVSSGSVNRSASWNGDLTAFWKATASYDQIDTITNRVTTTVDTKYSLRSTFDFKTINLYLEPTYDITMKDDRVKPEETDTRDFKFKVAWKALTTKNMEGRVDHTYGRKTDSALQNITRTDATNANLSWMEPLPGWLFAFDVTRSASDTSEDDLPPDITTTFSLKADYRFRVLFFAMNLKYDLKNPSDSTENFDFKAGWVAPSWDVSLSYTWKKTFSAALNEGYSINLTFKYNL